MRDLCRTLREEVASALSEPRMAHVDATARVCRRLARLYGEEPEAACAAGLYHDAMREQGDEKLLAMASQYGLPVGPLEQAYPVLLHGPAAAAVLQARHGVQRRDVLEAIAWHTTGHEGMGAMAKILYVADLIEPTRSFPGVERLRNMISDGLQSLFFACVKHNTLHIIEKERKLHPDAVACWNGCCGLGGPIGIKGKS